MANKAQLRLAAEDAAAKEQEKKAAEELDKARKIEELLQRQEALKAEAVRQEDLKAESLRIEMELQILNKNKTISVGEIVIESPTTPAVNGDDRLINMFADSIQRSSNRPATEPNNYGKLLARQTYGRDLLLFNGSPEQWPQFIADYERTTASCGFTSAENLSRLRKCLKGEAAKAVLSLMVCPDNEPEVMHTLKTRFGQPEHVIRAMINKAKELPRVKEDKMESFINFGTAVINMTATIKALGGAAHLANLNLLEELENQLPVSQRIQWREWILMNPGKSRDLINFTDWLKSKVEIMCSMCPVKIKDYQTEERYHGHNREKPRRPGEHSMAIEGQSSQQSNQSRFKGNSGPNKKCLFCDQSGHKLQQCQKYLEASLDIKWKHIRERNLCFSCLNFGHRTEKCRSKKDCGKDGCLQKHHPSLHKLTQGPTPQIERVNQIQEQREEEGKRHGSVSYALQEHDHGDDDSDYPESKMRIIPIHVEGPKGSVEAYAFLDPGSSVSLITNSLANELGIRGRKIKLKLTGVNKTGDDQNSRELNFKIRTIDQERSFNLVKVCTVSSLPVIQQSVTTSLLNKYKHLKGLNIATFKNGRPAILIGQDHGELICSNEVRTGKPSAPIAIKTPLGWIVSGRRSAASREESAYHVRNEAEEKLEEIHQMIKQSFEIESIGIKVYNNKPRTIEDEESQRIMDESLRDIGGQ